MSDLDNYRKEIDDIDKEITRLFEERMNVVLKVAEYKKKNNLEIFHKGREEVVINKNINRLKNKDYKVELEKFFVGMMEVSKELQKRKLNRENYGLVGETLSHSLSPEIHKVIFDKLNIEGEYNLIEIPKEKIENIKEILNISNLKGVNVTIPYKETVIKNLDFISDEAKKIGAVNTIFNKNGELLGYNTDYYGFKYMLENNEINVLNKKVVVLGTGGASKAVVTYLLDSGAKEIIIVSRSKKKLYEDFKNIKVLTYEEMKDIKGYAIINATPVGMYPNIDFSPVSEEIIEGFDVVIDLIYNPLKTKFLKFGIEKGKITCDGLMMLVLQGVKAEEIWQEKSINKEVILEIYNKLLKLLN
ncbi:shikimate dehydrogenase [Clostridium sp. Ade.TY]|uniref:shikimate dehydrogenase n=1 Tax=Clostridium sp. Ade.TY TaxID=1391647 RepID=UPI000429042E